MEIETQMFSPFRSKPKEVNVEDSTVGIDIVESIELSPLTSRVGFGGGAKIDYVAWDFAGQLEYSTLHPVFHNTITIIKI